MTRQHKIRIYFHEGDTDKTFEQLCFIALSIKKWINSKLNDRYKEFIYIIESEYCENGERGARFSFNDPTNPTKEFTSGHMGLNVDFNEKWHDVLSGIFDSVYIAACDAIAHNTFTRRAP